MQLQRTEERRERLERRIGGASNVARVLSGVKKLAKDTGVGQQ
jgi:hypothetical protein